MKKPHHNYDVRAGHENHQNGTSLPSTKATTDGEDILPLLDLVNMVASKPTPPVTEEKGDTTIILKKSVHVKNPRLSCTKGIRETTQLGKL
jgi:hypothetical protein